ncbi:LysR family transcriptional regulator [Janibacter melonis]|uniref:LysR family transcriptional regulator n=1 Tax=Janibacter melonis TaxID=262209 RepID=A0A176QGG2_9MICO|nr:LysR family transcriptional regulator [Janibacter melonis]OAB88760.1 LysR family transcriptional regulator [Janibacter melonis]
MAWDLRALEFFVAAADAGSFTEAAARLYVSQAAVSRTIATLEHDVGDRLLRRVPRGCELTSVGQQVLPQARRVLAEAERFTDFLTTRHGVLRLGYAWAALGVHTAPLQRQWSTERTGSTLQLVRHNSPTGGLVEGVCDVAVIRRAPEDPRLDSVVVGLERRLVAFASDDERWARRRVITMAEIAERTVIVDPRSGTTSSDLWPQAHAPHDYLESTDVDHWLDAIAAGRGVGTTAEATEHHHSRHGVTFRPVKDGPRVPVRLAWWRDSVPSGLGDLVDAVTRLYSGG